MGGRVALVWLLGGLLSLGSAAACRDFQLEQSVGGGQPTTSAAANGGDGPEKAREAGTAAAGGSSVIVTGSSGGGMSISCVVSESGAGGALGGSGPSEAQDGGAPEGPPGGGAEPQTNGAPKVLHPLGALADSPEEIAARRIAAPKFTSSLPPRVDLADSLPPPGDQGTQRSSVAWALAYTIKTYQEGLRAKWPLLNERYHYSPSWIYNQVNGGVDEGARPSVALSLLVEKGADTLKFFPYRADSFTTQPDAASMARAGRFVSSSWGTIDVDVTTLKKTLAARQPVLLTFEVFPDLDELGLANPTYDNAGGPSRGRHAVVLTGYDDERAAFRFVNSWSSSWGLSGYGWLDFAFATSFELQLVAYLVNDAKNAPPAQTDSLYVAENGQLWRVDNEFGDFMALSQADWTESTAVAILGGALYVTQAGYLHQVNTGDGSYTLLGEKVWSGTTAMVGLAGKLYATQGADLWLVSSLTSGARTRLGTAHWDGASALAALDGALYVIHAGALKKVDPATGAATQVGGANWYGAASLVALGAHLFIANGNGLWRVEDSSTGAFRRLGNDDWSGAGSLTQLGGQLYLIQAERLWQVDPTTGERQAIGAPSTWVGPTLLAALP